MRVFTSLSALILAGAGAFCFAYYMNGYSGVAFILGLALLLYGLFHFISYFIGFRKSHLPESVFVDGVYSLVIGFLAIANLIPDGSISVYFGSWLLVGGICRCTESLAVSKINPKNWFAVLPLGMINTIFGFVLLIPTFLSDVNDLYAIAIAFILQAFSVAVYAMYMVKRKETTKAKEAKERAKAKKLAAEAQRKERDRQRSLSQAEREAELEAQRLAKVKDAEEKAEARKAKKEARRPASEKTIDFTVEETKEIIRLADEKKDKAVHVNDEDEVSQADLEIAARPVFNKPTNIPTIEKTAVSDEPKIESFRVEEKRRLVNLEEIENKIPEVKFENPDLPEPEIRSAGGESARRKAFLLEIEDEMPKEEKPEDLSSFKPLTLEDLFADEKYAIKPLSDKKALETDLKLTQTFTFDWLDTNK